MKKIPLSAHLRARPAVPDVQAQELQRLKTHIQQAVDSLKQANINTLPWEDRNAIGNALNELYTAQKEPT